MLRQWGLCFAWLCQWRRGVPARAAMGRRPQASPGGALMQRLGDLVPTLISCSPPVTDRTSWRPFLKPSQISRHKENDMKIKRSPFQVIVLFSAVLMGLALLMPARAFATGGADSIERWNIAMTDFSAGPPLFVLTPIVQMRAHADARLAKLYAVQAASHPSRAR